MTEFKEKCVSWEGTRPCAFQKSGETPGCENCLFHNPILGNVLLIEAGGLGSITRTSVVAKEIKERHPNFRVQWLTHERGAELLKNVPSVDRALIATPETLFALEAQRFDTVINFEAGPVFLALAAKLSADKTFGFRMNDVGNLGLASEVSSNLLRWQTDDYFRRRLNTAPVQQLLLEAAGMEWKEQAYDVVTQPKDDEWAMEWLAEQLPGIWLERRKIIGLNIGSARKHDAKRWAGKNFYEFIKKVRESDMAGDTVCVVLGGPEEEREYEELHKEVTGARIPNVVFPGTKNPIARFLSLVKTCDVVVSADTFGMHAALAFAKPVVSLHGPQPEQEIYLYGGGSKVHLNLDCAPCFAGRVGHCQNDLKLRCMTDIGIQPVFDAVTKEVRK